MLYTLEREWAGFSPEERARWRAEKALPILEDLHTWLLELAARRDVLPQSPIGKAVAYSLNRWDKLCAYAHTGHVKIDSNGVENAIRVISIGRKNFLFAGSHEAAQWTAVFYSLLGSCKKNGVEPFEWLRKTLETIPAHHGSHIKELLPNYKAA